MLHIFDILCETIIGTIIFIIIQHLTIQLVPSSQSDNAYKFTQLPVLCILLLFWTEKFCNVC